MQWTTKILVVIWLCLFARIQSQARTPQTAPATIETIRLNSSPAGLSIEVALSAPFIPHGERLTNPDRLVFDFPGFRLAAANSQILVQNGPVRKVRSALFQSDPPIARIVLDLKEAVHFEVRSVGSDVVIDIPFSTVGFSSPGVARPAALLEKETQPEASKENTSRGNTKKASEPAFGAGPSVTAYKLQDKAKLLKLEDLQNLEDKAAAGDPEAETTLALALHGATLLKRDDIKALHLLQEAGDQGFVAAQESLGIFFEMGIGMEKPVPGEALKWFRKATQHGSLDAATNMALMYEDGNGVPKDPKQAMLWFRHAAEGGEPTAEYNLALIYARGKEAPQDFKESVRWLTAAADQDVLPAALDLAAFQLHPPDGTSADVHRAIHYYEKAASLGSVPAEVVLGDIFSAGLEEKPDYEQAATWYRKAAEQGDRDGEFGLAMRYVLGQGLPLDLEQAFRLFLAAANQGEPRSQYALATLYGEGKGTPPDAALAAHYLQLAAEQGMAQAQYSLGKLLASKKEARADRVAACKWLTLAESSVKESAVLLAELRKSMSAEEIKEAEGQVDSWRTAHAGNPAP